MKQIFYFFILSSLILACSSESGEFKDTRDGKTYKTVKIGSQIWLAENFAYKADNGCWAYKNDENNVSKYGYLYDWETAQKVVPDGWHLPTMDEYTEMLNNCGRTKEAIHKALINIDESGFSILFAGGKTGNASFDLEGKMAFFWTSTLNSNTSAYYFWISKENYFGDGLLGLSPVFNKMGYSVRFVKD